MSPTKSLPVAKKKQLKVSAATGCSLDREFVNQELGQGFSNIIMKARFVPNVKEEVMTGFKIFAIVKDSLIAKTGMQNGDILRQVNKVVLNQPEQGFVLFQAFQDEDEVRLSILRNGEPKTIKCRIK